MSKPSASKRLYGWVDDRFPVTKMWNEHVGEYYAPKNFNFWYYFGSLALLVLVNQIVTGIFLTMHYQPSAELAFDSIERMMRDVPWGTQIRYAHTTGASFFFIVVYLHMFRGLLYGSYQKPRELVWIIGMFILLALMAIAFMGYVLPWGQMSFWGAQVITNIFSTIPLVGDDLVVWIRGDFATSGVTLNRFFALHVIALPLVLLGLVVLHVLALHEVGSNNPDGVDIKKHKDEHGKPKDGIPFHPYYSVKDLFGVGVFLMLFCSVMFFFPEGPPVPFLDEIGHWFIERPNFVPANPAVTPEHITPVWYFGPFYSILRAVPSAPPELGGQIWGVIAMGASLILFFFMPWLDGSKARSMRYKGFFQKLNLAMFVVAFVILLFTGMNPSDSEFSLWPSAVLGMPGPINATMAVVGTIMYFAYFPLLAIISRIEPCKEVPDRVTYEKH